MICRDCGYFNGGNDESGSCKNHSNPFPMTKPNSECALTRSKLSCRNCTYWVEAEGYEREDDCGGCTFAGRGYFPMFLNEKCDLKEPYKSQVEKEMGY